MGAEWCLGWCSEHKGLQLIAMLQIPGLGSYGEGMHHSGKNVKPGRGDLRECSQAPLQQQSVSLQHSLSGPEPKLTWVKAVNKKGWREITSILFLNPDPVAHLVGHANEAPVVVDGWEVTALIDLGAQVSNMDLDLEIQPLGRLLELEGTGGAAIPYLRSVEVNLQIPEIRDYNEGCTAVGHPHHNLLWRSSGHSGFKNHRQSSELHDCRGTCTSNCDMVTGSFWGSLVGVSATIPWQLRQNQVRREDRELLSGEQPCGGVEVPVRWYQRHCQHHTEGHYPTIPCS